MKQHNKAIMDENARAKMFFFSFLDIVDKFEFEEGQQNMVLGSSTDGRRRTDAWEEMNERNQQHRPSVIHHSFIIIILLMMIITSTVILSSIVFTIAVTSQILIPIS